MKEEEVGHRVPENNINLGMFDIERTGKIEGEKNESFGFGDI